MNLACVSDAAAEAAAKLHAGACANLRTRACIRESQLNSASGTRSCLDSNARSHLRTQTGADANLRACAQIDAETCGTAYRDAGREVHQSSRRHHARILDSIGQGGLSPVGAGFRGALLKWPAGGYRFEGLHARRTSEYGSLFWIKNDFLPGDADVHTGP